MAALFDAVHVAITELRGDQPELVAVTSGLAPTAGISGDAKGDATTKLYQELSRGDSVLTDNLNESHEAAHIKAYHAGLLSLLQIGYHALDGSLAGAITLGSERRAAFDQPDGETLKDLADTYTLSMARARARESTLPNYGAADTAPKRFDVTDLLTPLGGDESIEAVAEHGARMIIELFDADECAITVNRDGYGTVVANVNRAGDHVHPDESAAHPWQGGGLYGTRSDSQQPTLPGLHEAAMRSEMFALIGPEDAPLGSIHLWSIQPGQFHESDSRELYKSVRPLNAVLSNFEGRRRAEARARQLERVNRMLATLSAGGTSAELSQVFLARCRQVLGAAMTAIIRYEVGASEGTVIQQDRGVWDVAFPAHLPLMDVTSTPRPVLIERPGQDGEEGTFSAQLEKLGLYSMVTAPLIVRGELYGAVTAWGEGENHFTTDDADLLAAVAGPFAIALEKSAALESLADSERRYRTLVSNAEEMIFLFDPESRRMLDSNDFAARSLGYTSNELSDLRIDDFFDGEPSLLTADIAALLDEGQLHITDRRYRGNDGNSFEVDIVASAISYDGRPVILMLARDVSEYRSLQRQLVHSQQMESLGSMAGMVAHDFNNLLTTILGFAGLLKRTATLDIEEHENLSMIEDAARRAADLTGRLLSFARGGLARFGPVNLCEVVADTLKLAQTAIPDRKSVV